MAFPIMLLTVAVAITCMMWTAVAMHHGGWERHKRPRQTSVRPGMSM